MPPVLGLSFRNVVMVDFDHVDFRKVKRLCMLALKRFRLGGFIILQSSPKHYHVVFDRPKRWSEVLRIVSWMGILADNVNVWKWVCMQAIKQNCTLRVSPKPCNPSFKPVPRVVYRFGSQNCMVEEFLAYRRRVLRMVKRLGVY